MEYEGSADGLPQEAVEVDDEDVDEEDDEGSAEDPHERNGVHRPMDVDDDDDEEEEDLENGVDDSAVNVNDDGDEDDEEEEVLAAVVVDDEDGYDDEDEDDEDEPASEVIAEAAVIDTKPASTKKSPAAKKRSAPPAAATPKSGRKRQPSSSTPGKKRSRNDGESHKPKVPTDRLKAAQQARSILNGAISTLPAEVSESYLVRNLGRLYAEASSEEPLFSSANALYPVGFSCDRFEFSPVHGRVIKLRCSILDGRKIRKKQINNFSEPTVSEGPVFRVMWGRGVDEDSDRVRYPYHMYRDSPHVNVERCGDTVEVPPKTNVDDRCVPVEGMRVKVQFEGNVFYSGSISEVGDTFFDKKHEMRTHIVIEYDDGHEEKAIYPDPDLFLLPPGTEDQTDEKGNVLLTHLNGAPVKCVIGQSALEAWGRLLVELGLIDEIILDAALRAVDTSRKEGLAEAKGKIEAQKLQRQQARAKKSTSQLTDDGDADEARSPHPWGVTTKREVHLYDKLSDEREIRDDATKRDPKLKNRIENLRNELNHLKELDRKASIALADARIREIGPFLSNPFNNSDQSRSQQVSWLTTAIRKEKVKMGSTGNRKKIVNATDLLERNNTFFNPHVEALLEGLPGSEYCSAYVFRSMRTGGATAISRVWVHEANLRQEREREKHLKLTKEAKAKATQVKEREMKRKKRDEVRDARKRQKLEEEDLKKKARAEERLSRLSLQVDERLNREAAFQREKVVGIMVKNLSREFSRRRKAAELVSGQAATSSKDLQTTTRSTPLVLPPLGRIYDEEILRVWDFMNSFGSTFLERGYVSALPTLESLQEAIDLLRMPESTQNGPARAKVLDSLIDLAVALCKPLAPSLTRHLFASLIALNPVLQKDFGAAFFNEVNASSGVKTDAEGSTPAILPVNSLTWQEIARLAFLADALGDLGLTKQESAHILRGYRSAGHPNSKEARRLRRSEDFYISLHRQKLSQGGLIPLLGSKTEPHSVRVELPSSPSCYPGDYKFYLHNIKSLPVGSVAAIKDNLTKALELLRSSGEEEELKSELDRINSTLAKVSLTEVLTSADLSICRKARTAVINLLDQAPEVDGVTALTNGGSHKDQDFSKFLGNVTQEAQECRRLRRDRMGLLETLSFSEPNYKEWVREREEYMTEALRLKEEMERKEKKDEEEEDDDDDDEEEEERPPASGKNSPAPSDSTGKKKGDSKRKSTEKPDESKEPDEARIDASDAVATVVENGNSTSDAPSSNSKRIGKPTEYDDFCADIPEAPEAIRRCLAVLRTLCGTNAAEPFIYPVDPQTNPGYYDVLVRPMCLREIGVKLQQSAIKYSHLPSQEQQVESTELLDLDQVVKEFGRNVRLIGKNALSYGNAGPTVVSAAGEMLRIFERLLLEWVLAPEKFLTPLDQLDDERCVEQHPTDDESMVLLCDGCEGKYNMSRLNPPLLEVPNGDWYCPRCLSGRWWVDLDPRVGKVIVRKTNTNDDRLTTSKGLIERCLVSFPEAGKSTLSYEVRFEASCLETWTLKEIDDALASSGDQVPPVRYLEAISESPGYGLGIDRGLRTEIVPIALNPNTSDAAAQVALGSAAFRDTIAAAGTLLLVNPEDMTASEWSRLLVLLIMKCSSSAVMQSLASKMENDANEKMMAASSSVEKISDIADVFPHVGDDDEATTETETKEPSIVVDVPEVTNDVKNGDKEVANQGNVETATVVVEATAVEVVEEKDVSAVTAVAENPVVDPAAVMEVERKSKRSAVQIEKERRQRAREDSIAALCIKKQIHSTVASFEEDTVSQVVDAMLSSKDPGLAISSTRCRGEVCAFCGLSDSALGSPLLRVPDAQEWKELIPHACRSRLTTLVADLPAEHEFSRSTATSRKLVTLKIRIDDELVSVKDDDEYFENIVDGGMLEFLPRNKDGFQSELQFRSDAKLPVVVGSLSAHECCAIAVHNTRKVQIVGEYKERRADLAEREFGLMCGRSLEIGKDVIGRSYWRFHSDPSSLFIDAGPALEGDSSIQGPWHRFSDAASISSVIVGLGKDPISRELRRTFPEADQMIKKRTWSNELLKKKFPGVCALSSQISISDDADSSGDVKMHDVGKTTEADDDDESYDERDDVLVESKSGKLLWDATILEVARPKNIGTIGYRVHYKGWSSRFDEWVEAKRVVEPNDNNRHVQEELLEDRALCRDFVPPSLENMSAKSFLRANDRARGSLPLPDFMSLLNLQPGSTSEDVALATMKAAILMIEAALPIGAVDNSPKGLWNLNFASQWRLMVQQAQGPESLIRCVILLEDVIAEDWMNPQVGHLRSCLPSRWKAVGEASPSSLAIRVFLLDQGLTYAVVDKRKQR